MISKSKLKSALQKLVEIQEINDPHRHCRLDISAHRIQDDSSGENFEDIGYDAYAVTEYEDEAKFGRAEVLYLWSQCKLHILKYGVTSEDEKAFRARLTRNVPGPIEFHLWVDLKPQQDALFKISGSVRSKFFYETLVKFTVRAIEVETG